MFNGVQKFKKNGSRDILTFEDFVVLKLAPHEKLLTKLE